MTILGTFKLSAESFYSIVPTFFLVIFRNEITTILTPSTSEGGGGGHVFRFGVP